MLCLNYCSLVGPLRSRLVNQCYGSGFVRSVCIRPPGSGVVIICTDPDLDLDPDPDPLSTIKKVRKTTMSTVFLLLFYFPDPDPHENVADPQTLDKICYIAYQGLSVVWRGSGMHSAW
jgi:hypothetical protein